MPIEQLPSPEAMRTSPKGARLLNKLFNIRPAEWPRFSLIYLMYFVAVIGKKWGEPVIEAAFLEQIGVGFLPWAFLINAVFTIFAIAVYTAFADRVSNRKLLMALFLLSAAGVAGGLGLLGWGWVAITYPLLYLILNVPLLDIFNVHWPTYVNSFYNTQSAKRVIPLLASSTRIAGILAALTLPILNRFLSPVGIIAIFLATLLISAAIAWAMPYLLKEDPQAGETASIGHATSSYVDNIREGFRYVLDSPFLRWLTAASLVLFILLPFINFQALQTFKHELQTTEKISNFIVILNGLGDLLALPLQLFLLNRLIGKIGLNNTSLIFPAGTAAISAALVFFQGIPAAALGYFGRTTFRTTFRNPIDSLLFNAVPLRIKGRARAFIGGLVVPVGSIIGGLLLLTPAVATSWFLPALTGLLAAAFLAGSLIVRREYSRAFITLLEQEDFSFLLSQSDSPIVAEPSTLQLLQQKLDQSHSPEFTIFMAQLISRIGSDAAIAMLGQTIRRAADSRLRAALVETITAAEVQGQAVSRLYTELLADSAGQVRQAAITGLEQVADPQDETYIAHMVAMLADPETGVGTRALAALVRSGKFYELPPTIELLSRLLTDPSPRQRAAGVSILGLLGQFGDDRASHNLAQYLSDAADEVRLEAATTLESLAGRLPARLTPLILEKLRPLLQDPVERVRQAALNVLGDMAQPESYEAIVRSLTDPSPTVRAAAADALARVGKSAIPILHPHLEAPDPQLRKMITVILSRINRREFGHLIKSHLTSNLLLIYRNFGRIGALSACPASPSLAVLKSALAEQNEELLHEIFYLLAAVYDQTSLMVITDSIGSDSARVRANATEALESLTTPQTAQLIAPLFEPEPN
ncbi:MAG: HEAT repeat domain-containing protein, partial [Chloroflexota bacterium]